MRAFPVVVASSALGFLFYAAGIRAEDTYIDPYGYCKTYFGSLEAFVEMAETVPQYNYDGRELCPPFWDFTPVSGAILRVCPPSFLPSDGPNYRAISIFLHFDPKDGNTPPSGILNAGLRDILITNGSVQLPLQYDNAEPAVLAPDESEFEIWNPVYTVNGTQAALENDEGGIIEFSCQDFRDVGYCGYLQDIKEGGCWHGQAFEMDRQSSFSFTVRFNDFEAWVDIWAEEEFVLGENKTRTGSYTTSHVKFWGNTNLPSITDYDFWENYGSYETASKYVNKEIELQADEAKMPVFANRTSSRERYFAGNGTFSTSNAVPNVVAGVLMRAMMSFLLGIFLLNW